MLDNRREVSRQNGEQPKTSAKGGRPKGVVREIVEATGLSDNTVRRALKPEAPAQPKPVKSDAEVILAQANAIVAAWNRACPEARNLLILFLLKGVPEHFRVGWFCAIMVFN